MPSRALLGDYYSKSWLTYPLAFWLTLMVDSCPCNGACN